MPIENGKWRLDKTVGQAQEAKMPSEERVVDE